MEHKCGSCDLRVYGRCTNGQSETCGEQVQQNDSCAGWFSTQEANTNQRLLEAAAVCRNAQHEIGYIINKLFPLSVATGAIGHLTVAAQCLKETADAIYHDQECG